MKGSSGNLKENSDEHHGEGPFDEDLVLCVCGVAGNVVDRGGAGGAEDEGDAVEEKCRGKGAEEEVLDGGFRALAGLLAVSGENVGGDRGDFESDEYDEEFGGGGQEAHADGSEDHECVVLALVVAVFRKSVEREEQSDDDNAANEHVKEDSEGAGL